MPLVKPQPGSRIDWSHPLSRGLIGFWLLNEGSGSRLVDLTGHADAAAGGTAWQPGPIGPELAFDGTTSSVEIPTYAALDAVTKLSVVAHVRDDNSGGGFAEIARKGAGGWFLLRNATGSGYWEFSVNGTNFGDSYTPSISGERAFLIGTHDGSRTKLYKNGIKYQDIAETGLLANAGGALDIGSLSGSSQFFQGRIASIRLYDRALSADEAARLTAEPFAMIEPPSTRRLFLPAGSGGGTGATANPTALAGTGVLLGPAATGAASATVAVLVGVGALPAVSASGGASVAPTVLVGSGVLLDSVATGGASASPTVLVGTGTLLAAVASGGGAGTAAPAVLVGAGILPTVLAFGGASAVPAALAGSGVLLAPTAGGGTGGTAGGGTGGTATVAVLVGVGAILAPSATGGASVAVASLAAHGTLLGAVFTTPAGDLIEAVSFLLEGHASVGTLAAGGVWPARAPAEVAFPYLTLGEPLAHTEFASVNVDGTRPFVRSSQVELIVYGSTRAEARALGLAARDALVDAAESGALTFSEGTLTYFLPAGPEGALDLDDEGPGGSECWQFVVTFEAIVNGALAAPTGG